MQQCLRAVTAAAFTVTLAGKTLATPFYTITDIGDLGGDYTHGRGINAVGQVVGESRTNSGDAHATVWQNGTLADVGPGGGKDSFDAGVNNVGQIVGGFTTGVGGPNAVWQAALWQGGTYKTLGDLGGGWSQAYAINTAGLIVGMSQTANGHDQATLWTNGTIIDLGDLWGGGSGGYSSAFDVNDAAQIAGQSDFGATLWQNGTAVDLKWPGGSNSAAYAINNLGQIVGEALNPNGLNYWGAAVWQNGSLAFLTDLGYGYSQALDINDLGQVVGFSRASPVPNGLGPDARVDAVLWDHGTVIDLNNLLDPALGVQLTQAVAINDDGQIVADGCYSHTGTCHAFLFDPNAVSVPEPASLALFGTAIASFGWARRREYKSAQTLRVRRN